MGVLRRLILIGAVVAFTLPGSNAESSGTGPVARSAMSMAPDRNGNLVMFGGDILAGQEFFDDTWTWDGTTWTEQHPADHPSARCCYGLAYDQARRETVLFGGSNGSVEFGDTWVWDGADWKQRYSKWSPLARSNLQMAYDPLMGVVVLYGGGYVMNDTWLWNGQSWKEWIHTPHPPARALAGFTYDPADREIVMFGGDGGCSDWGCLTWNSTWIWHMGNWTRLWPDVHPGTNLEMGMAYDPVGRVALMFGGCCARDLTWAWDGGIWTKLHPATSPPAMERMAMATDPLRGNIVLFGGRDVDLVDFGATWIWDGSTWSCLLGC